MAWVLLDFYCEKCKAQFEDLVDTKERGEPVPCPECSTKCAATLSVPKIGAFSAMSKDFQQEALKKRSAEHTAKTVASDGSAQFNRKYDKKKK